MQSVTSVTNCHQGAVTKNSEVKFMYIIKIYILISSIYSFILYCHHCHLYFLSFISFDYFFPVVIEHMGIGSILLFFFLILGGDSGDSSEKSRFNLVNTGFKLSPAKGDTLVTVVTKGDRSSDV